jgi:hypothetical protein
MYQRVTGDWPEGIGTAEDRGRLTRYAEALAFYEGDQWIGRRQRGETRLTFNYARALLRKVASYVFPATVSFSVPAEGETPPGGGRWPKGPEGDEATASRAEQALAAAIAENDLARLDIELCVEASVLGDAAVKVTWDVETGRPVVVGVNPATLAAHWLPDRPRQVEQISQVYRMTGEAVTRSFGENAGALLAAGRDYPVVENWTAERWVVEIAGQRIRDEPNPYGWIPYVVAPNNPRPHCFWGESDLVDLFDICRELNARMSVLGRVLELSGAPIAVLENVDGSDGIAVAPGAKWELPEGAKAYLLDLLGGGGVQLHIDYVNLLYRALHDLSETPRTAFGDSGRALSGAALEVEIQPLVQRVHRKRQMWETVFRERNARLLDLLERFGGLDLGGLRRSVTIWPSVLPSDTDSAVQNAARLVASGIQSRRTAAAALGGNDPDGELARVLDEMTRFAAITSGENA